jgi:hypothetical protein
MITHDDMIDCVRRRRSNDDLRPASRRRQDLQDDVAAYLAAGGQISTPIATDPLRLRVTTGVRAGSAQRTWVKAPPILHPLALKPKNRAG